MAALARDDVHDGAPRCLLGLFDTASGGLADWSEFDGEAERLSIEVRGLSHEGLAALIESSTLEIPTTEHRGLHQEASDFVRWGRRGGLMLDPWPSTPVLLAARKRVSSVVHRTSLLQTMASGRHLGAHQRGFARKYTHAQRSRAPTERWHPRHPIGEDRQRRRYSGLRWGEEAQRQKAASIGRYAEYGAQSQGALVEPARSCSGASGAGGNGRRVPSP